MPWHTRAYMTRCAVSGCKKRATVEVYDNFNGNYGLHCTSHGKARVVRENKARDEYNKFHRDDGQLAKYKGEKT